MCPEEGDQDDERPQGQDLPGAAVTWLVFETLEGGPHRSLHLPQGGAAEGEVLISSSP